MQAGEPRSSQTDPRKGLDPNIVRCYTQRSAPARFVQELRKPDVCAFRMRRRSGANALSAEDDSNIVLAAELGCIPVRVNVQQALIRRRCTEQGDPNLSWTRTAGHDRSIAAHTGAQCRNDVARSRHSKLLEDCELVTCEDISPDKCAATGQLPHGTRSLSDRQRFPT
jgi:hypothetical protein